MMQLITPDRYGEFVDELVEMHRLRYRVFKEPLDREVRVSGDLEVDEFDALHPADLLQRGMDARIQCCVRLLPSTGPTMLRQAFPALLDGQPAAENPTIWESSQFSLDLSNGAPKAGSCIARATCELFAGMIEFGLSRHLTEIVTVTDTRIERILPRAAWPLRRIGEPKPLGATLAVASYLDVSTDSLGRVRKVGDIKEPVVWAPVAPLPV